MPSRAHRQRASATFRRRRLAVGGGIAVVVLGAVIGLVATSGGPKAAARTPGTTSTSPSTTTTQVAADRCPLTDLPAPHGVPDRPAIGIKVGNEPEGARPQSGLDEADIVYDTPAEGFVMRYVAVYQCNNVSSVGPNRSVRWVDWHVMAQFGHPILAFAGGITPDVDTVMGLGWLHPANLLEGAQGAAIRTTNRVPPDNLYSNTAALYSMFKGATGAPHSVFLFTRALPSSAAPVATVGINYSFDTDVLWKWDNSSDSWLHTYSGTPDVDALTGRPVTATNVVLQVVSYSFGPYAESPGSTGDVQSQTVGSGTGYVFRNGKGIKVTWRRATASDPTTFTDSAGHSVGLAPGRTWVEIVPDTTSYKITP
jgi:hypothetical protein